MSELFDDSDEEKALVVEEDLIDTEDLIADTSRQKQFSDARRRLESLMEEKKLRAELEDYLDEY